MKSLKEGFTLCPMKGILVRPFLLTDAVVLFTAIDANRAYLRRWLTWVDGVVGVTGVTKFLERNSIDCKFPDTLVHGIFCGERLIGSVDYDVGSAEYAHMTEIGYWLAEDMQGRGIMTASVRAMVQALFEEAKLQRITLCCSDGNTKSEALIRRLGFHHEGTLRKYVYLHGRLVDRKVFGLLEEEYRKGKPEVL